MSPQWFLDGVRGLSEIDTDAGVAALEGARGRRMRNVTARMPMPRWIERSCGVFCLAAVTLLPANAVGTSNTSPVGAADMQVAITFDDLPEHGDLPPGISRAGVARSIIHTLKVRHAPPIYGFINADGLAGDPADGEVLRLWRAAGFSLGNHTFSHPDANVVTASTFEQDVLADESTLQKYMGGHNWHWLRLPYLHEGDTPEKRDEIASFIKMHRYHIAQVTLSFDDYAYNDPYARCIATGNAAAVAWLKQSFLDRASVDILAAHKMSELLYGRDIKHVLLMHIGAFDAVMLPKLLDMYKRRGVELISLPDSESDPAYKNADEQQFDWGGTMLEEQMIARGIPIPDFANRDDALDQIDALCK